MEKRSIALIMTLALAFSLAACASTAKVNENEDKAETAQPAQEPEVTEPVTEQPAATETQEAQPAQEEVKQTRAEKLLAEGEAGNGRSYTDLGRMYEKGNGVEQDYDKALEYYYLSAEAEKPDFKGMRYAGLMYKDGTGVEQDYAKAAECFQKAAEAGDVSAAYFLGTFYEEGNGVTESLEEAKKWYEKAVSTVDEFLSNSKNNGPDELKLALCRLAEMALSEDDTETAIKYYEYASRLGWSAAAEKLAELGVTTE